jgi:hypothetical protein
MKKILILIIVASTSLICWAGRWQTITDTSHVYDLMPQDDGIYFSTWGGVVKIIPPVNTPNGPTLDQYSEEKVWTTADGLSSNDVRNIEYISLSNSYWFGSAFDGISIINPLGVQQLNEELGLPSNNVKKIVEYGSEILVATSNGLAAYYYLEGVNFPLMLHQYTNQNTSGGLLDNQIDDMVLAHNNYLFLSTTEGINYVHLDSLDVDTAWHHFESAPYPVGFEKKLSYSNSQILITSSTSVYLHSIDPWDPSWQSYGQASGLTGDVISSACIDNEGAIWASYGVWDEDFLSYANTSDTLLTKIWPNGGVKQWSKFESGLGDKCVSKIVSGGNFIYLCTWGDGIYRNQSIWSEGRTGADIVSWMHFQPNSIGFPKITNIALDDNLAAWFSSGNLNHLPLKKSALGASTYLDGDWTTLNIANSPIHTDNILCVTVDSRNRKWFGTYDVNAESPDGWNYGISIFDDTNNIWKKIDRGGIRQWSEANQSWGPYISTDGVLGNTDVFITKDQHDNMFVACFDNGYTVYDANDNKIGTFLVDNSVYQRSIFCYHNGSQYFFGMYNDPGLVIWDDDSIPVTGGDHWVIPEPADLGSCEVYGVVTVDTPYEGRQHWIAASNGLFMWDEQDWYKWDTSVKRFIYNNATGLWDNDLLYYADEERLFGSVRTTPTAIMLDPFNRIWIGSLEHGISMYDPETERFTNYFKDNSPLLSDYITAFGYQPEEGWLFIGTPEGLNTLSIGRTIKPDTQLGSLKIFPNPFHPDGREEVQISNYPTDIMPRGQNQCRIYDSSGMLVRILDENEFSRFAWDGMNAKGFSCSSGVYFVVVTDAKGKRLTGKIALLR